MAQGNKPKKVSTFGDILRKRPPAQFPKGFDFLHLEDGKEIFYDSMNSGWAWYDDPSRSRPDIANNVPDTDEDVAELDFSGDHISEGRD